MRKDKYEERIGLVTPGSGFTCHNCLENEDDYENEENTVVLVTDTWAPEVGCCKHCGVFAGDLV